MLEERINKLIDSVDALTLVIQRLWDQKEDIKGINAPPISADPPKTKTEKPKKEKPEETPQGITHEELHKLCLAVSRKDPEGNKKKIQKILKNRLVKDLPAEELEAAKAKLEKL